LPATVALACADARKPWLVGISAPKPLGRNPYLQCVGLFRFLLSLSMQVHASVFKAYDIRGIVDKTIDESFAMPRMS